ncbi:hypothetical protein VOLCADRAFT_106405 [Volvox carteri f. nagariensis]|uniref:MULE transposase domain-containing protein n=1 Tax=Volvox carteri f. nagariensis TaxID=3068 RepID=D8U759_VOLCA|nr:uncharacterized protein VOLCADRAFT_106405 [Volvox carteri f. nagariensis]EFJ44425.1 hypothetical protein VOLCADRAFT_106405 [Volvox carteri f. nagariensis]|eukprot:XP_002954532.1 hypothetical protein VOLCADRAFT_106405 [Volvox carteri f. nagariensis]
MPAAAAAATAGVTAAAGGGPAVRVVQQGFRLTLTAPWLVQLLKLYVGRIVLMDATYGLTSYNYPVISLLVVDQHDNGIPIVFGVIPSAEGKEDVQGFIQDVEDLAGRSSAGPRAAGVPPLVPRARTQPAETGIGAGTAGMAAVQLEEEEDYCVIVE